MLALAAGVACAPAANAPPATPPEPASDVGQEPGPPLAVKEFQAVTVRGKVGNGGFDHPDATHFYEPHLGTCGLQVASAASEWAHAAKLAILRSDVASQTVRIHISADQAINGFFEVLYSRSGEGAVLRVNYYDRRGLAQFLPTAEFEQLSSAAQGAMLCKS